jgi:hypothetical protein
MAGLLLHLPQEAPVFPVLVTQVAVAAARILMVEAPNMVVTELLA